MYKPCPFLIPEVQDELVRWYGTPMSVSDIVFRTIATIGTIHPHTAEHMIRTAGAYHSFTGKLEYFLEVADHDKFKTESIFYENIATNPRTLQRSPEVKGQIFRHVCVAPIGMRNLSYNFGVPYSPEWMAIIALHHYLGSGMPGRDAPPTIDDFEFHPKFSAEDKAFLLQAMARLENGMGGVTDTIAELTAIDIIDAQFRRPYMSALPWREMLLRIETAVLRTRLPESLKYRSLDWIQGFSSEQEYYNETLTSGWRDLEAPDNFHETYAHRMANDNQVFEWLTFINNKY